MSGGTRCKCAESKKPIKERTWFIMQFKCNHSAFSGYRQTSSDYSSIVCTSCNRAWRTKAGYVDNLQMQSVTRAGP